MRLVPQTIIRTWRDAISNHKVLGSLATVIVLISFLILGLSLQYWRLNLSFTLDRIDQWELAPRSGADSTVPSNAISDADTLPNRVIIGSSAGTKVGIQAKWTDPEEADTTLSYSLDENAEGRFRIDSKTGIVRVADGSRFDPAKLPTHTLIIRAESEGEPAEQPRTQEFAISVEREPRSLLGCLVLGDRDDTATGIVPATSPGEAHRAASNQVPSCLEPYLVDLSVVSPTLVAVTAAFTMIGAFILIGFMARESMPEDGWEQRSIQSATFPFPSRYRTYYVQMGLIGTIFGFVIAFSHLDQEARNTGALIDALGTALWSTLIALILAYVICALAIEPIFQWVRERIPGWVPPDGAARETIEDLKKQATEVATGYRALTETTATLTAATKELTTATRTLKEELGVEAMRQNMVELRDDVTRLGKDVGELQITLKQTITASNTTSIQLDNNSTRLKETEGALNTLSAGVTELTGKLKNIFK